MKRIAMAGALLALAVPATANAQETPTPRENAARACKALRTSLGTDTFRTTYGTNKTRRNAFGKCVSKWVDKAQDAQSNAAKACDAERDDPNFPTSHDGKTFAQFYGTNANGRNAYGKCVSSKARDELDAEVDATENAARTCKAERTSLGREEFKAKWGGKRNAFGKCVSAAAKAQQDS